MVTFLFTDVEGSTALWEQHADAMGSALGHHDEVVRSTIEAHGGYVFSTGGDGFAAVFDRADRAVRAAVAAQAALAGATWPQGLSLAVRMGLHSGEAQERDGDYFGAAVNRAARVMDAANGAQILVSGATYEIIGDTPASWRWVDLNVHELRDVVHPVRLYRVETSEFGGDPRPPRTGAFRAGNLPAASAPLVGRAEDIEEIVADLTTARVVTLTGVGGIGKTRLAVEVGRRLEGQRPDGVWLAALDTVDRPDELVTVLLGLFGIEAPSIDGLESLVHGLRHRDALLILDNCEHVLDVAAATATAIASSCPRMTLLATSREPLDVDGERVRRVRSLSVDDGGPAVELFRLRAAHAGAALDAARDHDAVLQICSRLDGIPLALELAAARTRSMHPSEIASRLDDMFRLLTRGKRSSTERHRTLRATLEWSHHLLTDAEQTVLARLSVFSGSFGLDAAESVAGPGAVGDVAVVDAVDRLVARSLVVALEDREDSRFRLLEPVRQLAAEKLADRDEVDMVRARHTEWYCALMSRIGSLWRSGADQIAWPMAAREMPNLRAAFDHLVEAARIDEAERFVFEAYGPIACQFDVAPMYDWAPRALGVAPDHIGPYTASACAVAAWGAIPQGQLDDAARWLRRGVEAIDAGSRDDGLVAAAAIHHVLAGGSVAVTDEFLERSVIAALESDDPHRQIWVLTYAGRLDEATARATRLGNRTLLALTLSWAPSVEADDGHERRELFWEAAHESHSYLMRNHATLELGVEQIRTGMPLDGLLLLRAPLRDWLLRGDQRVWSVLHAIAVGFVNLGETVAAARLAGAIGDRPLPFVDRRRRTELPSLLDARDATSRRRHEAAGAALDAGAAVAEALDLIEALATTPTDGPGHASTDMADLTARQREVARLVAQGFSNKKIAQRLDISPYTAETHVRNILERLGAASRAEIATWYASRQRASGTPLRT